MMPTRPSKTLREMAEDTAKIESGGKGIACQVCGCRDLRVQTTRRQDGLILRYRVCRHCGQHRATIES